MQQESVSWTVVKFLNDNSVEAVPTKWISPDSFCFWPPFTSEKVAQAIKHQDLDTCWPTYKVDIFRNGTYDQYDIARGKAKRAEETSDLNSDIEMKKDVRRKKANKRYFSSSSEEEAIRVKSPPQLKMFKKKLSADKGRTMVNPIKKFNRVLDFNEQPSASAFISKETQEQNLEANSSQLDVCNDNNYQNSSAHISLGNLLFDQDNNQNNIADISLEATPAVTQNKDIGSQNTALCTCCRVHSAYLRTILKSQQTNRSLLIDILEQMKVQNKGHQYSEVQADNNSVFNQFILPANTTEDLLEVDNYLKSEDIFPKAVLEISRLGGRTNYDLVRRILTYFITNELGAKYSWLGRREKINFKSLEIARLIIEVTKLCKMGTVQDTEMSISKWLRRARDRSKTGDKK